MSGGESLPEALVTALLPRVKELWNSYGPTETTVSATYDPIRSGREIAIGRPIANTRIHILDDHRHRVPVGVTGEIYIAGAGVAAGYVNRPEETAQRFLPDPFAGTGTMYRSGDLGRYLPDGRIQHLGRADDQVKIRGFRIEPAEVEAALLARDGVAAAVVVAREDRPGDRRLVAYVVPQGEMPSVSALRSGLRRTLPEYMVPSAFVAVQQIPTTASGKIDRKALPAPPTKGPEPGPVQVGGASNLEADLARIWARVIGVSGVGRDQDFFDLGGHSLLAVRTLLEVERELGFEVPLAALFDGGSTVSGMAAVIEGRNDRPLALRPSLFFVHPQAATVPAMRHFTGPLGPDQPVEALLPERPGGLFDRTSSIEAMALPLLAAVRAVQPHGPYLLAGYSIGGPLAYEIAGRLRAAGETVAWLGLLDAPSSTVLDRRPSQRQLVLHYARKGPRVLVRECISASRREFRQFHLNRHPENSDAFDHRGAEHLGTRYRPAGHDAPLTLFTTDHSVTTQRLGPTLGWEYVHRGRLSVTSVPGNHDSVLREPDVARTAEVFADSLRAAVTT